MHHPLRLGPPPRTLLWRSEFRQGYLVSVKLEDPKGSVEEIRTEAPPALQRQEDSEGYTELGEPWPMTAWDAERHEAHSPRKKSRGHGLRLGKQHRGQERRKVTGAPLLMREAVLPRPGMRTCVCT